jgi:hypothetical protein
MVMEWAGLRVFPQIERAMGILTQLLDCFSTWTREDSIEILHFQVVDLVWIDSGSDVMRPMLKVCFDSGFHSSAMSLQHSCCHMR